MDKDSKGQRKMEDSGGGLLPAVEGHSLKLNNQPLPVSTRSVLSGIRQYRFDTGFLFCLFVVFVVETSTLV